MNIIFNQEFERINLVSKSGMFSTDEFQAAIKDMVKTYKPYISSSIECMITTTKKVEIVDGIQLLDAEILLPVSCYIPVESPYIFKEKIKLTNALYTKIEEIEKLQDEINGFNQYIISNELQPITSAYFVQTQKDNKPTVEIYIGLNPNIL